MVALKMCAPAKWSPDAASKPRAEEKDAPSQSARGARGDQGPRDVARYARARARAARRRGRCAARYSSQFMCTAVELQNSETEQSFESIPLLPPSIPGHPRGGHDDDEPMAVLARPWQSETLVHQPPPSISSSHVEAPAPTPGRMYCRGGEYIFRVIAVRAV